MFSAALLLAARGRGRGRRKLKGGDGLGKQVEATGPLHRAICDNRPCRPGEGNLVGYEHWKQPYELPSAASLAKRPPHGPASPLYSELVAVAKRVQSSRAFVLLTVADFDFREVAENWHKAATRANMPNAVVWSLDGDAYAHLSSRGVPTANGTAAIEAWAQTKLQRHLQRALAERQMAAAALVHAGLDVLVSDATWTYVRDAAPWFAAQPATVEHQHGRWDAACAGGPRSSKKWSANPQYWLTVRPPPTGAALARVRLRLEASKPTADQIAATRDSGNVAASAMGARAEASLPDPCVWETVSWVQEHAAEFVSARTWA